MLCKPSVMSRMRVTGGMFILGGILADKEWGCFGRWRTRCKSSGLKLAVMPSQRAVVDRPLFECCLSCSTYKIGNGQDK